MLVTIVCAILFYLLAIVFAWKADKRDENKASNNYNLLAYIRFYFLCLYVYVEGEIEIK